MDINRPASICMSTADRIYELVRSLPPEQADEVLNFVEFLQHKISATTTAESYGIIPPGTLTGLRGIAKRVGQTLTQEELQEDYTEYLDNKYQ